MQQVTGITSTPAQIINLTADDGSAATLTLEYRPQQTGWYLDLTWNGTSPALQINGLRVTNFPNLLRQWRNLLTFGLAVVTKDGFEPLAIGDFESGYATMIFLSSPVDVALVEAQVFNGRNLP